ncbi:SDR family NAD(P)-dependent oxidoreductase [Amycolatopsis sacchari]|uniref:SDR family NAD(P)-dependent oxidoreductase n=1 Tax=Amycolatopsis sacchari TaxID=115433 RepID=UPI003D735A46
MRTWFITGTSRGLGREIASAALAAGDAVVATARRPEEAARALPDADGRLLTAAVDITDATQVRRAVRAAVDRFGGIDVLVNNAGRGLLGAVEEVTDAEARAVFDTNVFGTLTVTREVLPMLRRQGAGTVVFISSVGGFTQGPGWGAYGATKAAIEAVGESLSAEVAPLGIGVLIVEPGIFRTDFLDDTSLHKAERTIDAYRPTAGNTRAWVRDHNHVQPGDAAKAAAAILTVVDAEKRPLRLQLGADCVARVEAKLERVAADLDQWRELAVATAHDDTGGDATAVPGYW